MSTLIDTIERQQARNKVPDFAPGDRVKVHFQVIEGTRRRTQVFEGVVLKRQGSGVRETFTVRKQSFGVGVERTFPVHSPKIERVEIAGRGDVRRAKLYYLRGRVGKRARVRERQYTAEDALGVQEEAEPLEAPPTPEPEGDAEAAAEAPAPEQVAAAGTPEEAPAAEETPAPAAEAEVAEPAEEEAAEPGAESGDEPEGVEDTTAEKPA